MVRVNPETAKLRKDIATELIRVNGNASVTNPEDLIKALNLITKAIITDPFIVERTEA